MLNSIKKKSKNTHFKTDYYVHKHNLINHRRYNIFANTILNRFLNAEIQVIRIYSRDEKSRMICGSIAKM
jgi:hypothetical protein